MAIITIDNYQVNARKPIDTRMVASSSTDREAIQYLYDGLKTFQLDTEKQWIYFNGTWSLVTEGTLSGTGSPYYVVRWGVTASTLENSNIYSAPNGNVGINTTNPLDTFQINTPFAGSQPLVIHKGSNSFIAENMYFDNLSRYNVFNTSNGSSYIAFNNGNLEFGNRQPLSSSFSSTASMILSSSGYIQYNYQLRSNSNNNASNPSYTWSTDTSTGIYYIPSHSYTSLSGSSGTTKGVGFSVGSSQIASIEANITTFYQSLIIQGNGSYNSLGFSNGSNRVVITPSGISANQTITIPNRNGYMGIFENILNQSDDSWCTCIRSGGDWLVGGSFASFNVIEIFQLNSVTVNSVSLQDGSYVKIKKLGNITLFIQSLQMTASATRSVDYIGLRFGVPTIGLTSSGFSSTIDNRGNTTWNVTTIKTLLTPESSAYIINGSPGTYTINTFVLNNYIGTSGTGYTFNSGNYQVTGSSLGTIQTGTIVH